MGTLHQQFIMLITTPLYIIIIGLEILVSNIRHRHSYSWRDTLHNFSLSMIAGVVDLVMRGVSLICLSWFFAISPLRWEHSFLYWAVLFLWVDMMHYWMHRLGHSCRLFWAVHVNHHSSEHFNFSVGFRASVLEPAYRFLFFIPIVIGGFQPIDILLMYSITEIWGILTHTEKIKRLGWLEQVLVTPSHHRVHHAANPLYLDKNMGTALIIWDKIFGTFQKELTPEEYQPIRYGLTTPQKDSLPTILFHEWEMIWKDVRRKDLTWRQKWQYVFGPPGWSHDGSRLTSDALRKREATGKSI